MEEVVLGCMKFTITSTKTYYRVTPFIHEMRSLKTMLFLSTNRKPAIHNLYCVTITV